MAALGAPDGDGAAAVLNHRRLDRHHDHLRRAPAVGWIADGEGAASTIVGDEVLLADEVGANVGALVAEAPAVPALGVERGVLECDRSLAGERTRRATEEVLGGDLVAVGLVEGPELDADLRRHELLDPDVALAEERAVLAGQAQLDRPGAAGLLGGHEERIAGHGAGGVGAGRDGAERLAARADKHQ